MKIEKIGRYDSRAEVERKLKIIKEHLEHTHPRVQYPNKEKIDALGQEARANWVLNCAHDFPFSVFLECGLSEKELREVARRRLADLELFESEDDHALTRHQRVEIKRLYDFLGF